LDEKREGFVLPCEGKVSFCWLRVGGPSSWGTNGRPKGGGPLMRHSARPAVDEGEKKRHGERGKGGRDAYIFF